MKQCPNAAVDKFEPNYNFYPQHYYMWADFIAKSSSCAQFQVLLNTLYSGNVYTISKSQFSSCAASLTSMFFLRADDAMRVPFTVVGFANSLTEQINRNNASPQGAEALTWNYAALIFADYDRRTRISDPL